MQVAARAAVDPRSAAKALRDGPDAVRGYAGERIANAMRELGVAPSNTEPPRAP